MTGPDDELLDQDKPGSEEGLVGEAALLAALPAGRSGTSHPHGLNDLYVALTRSTTGVLLMIGTFADRGAPSSPDAPAAMPVFTTREAAEEFVAGDPLVRNGGRP